MGHPYGYTVFLTLSLSLSLVSLSMARNNSHNPVLPRVVATVTSLDPRGLATIQTVDGALYEIVTGTGWRVGDVVECEQNERVRVKWQALDCRQAS